MRSIFRRWFAAGLFLFLLTLPLSLAGCSSQTAAERAADLAARQELAAAPRHGNTPDYSLGPAELAKADHLNRVGELLHFGDEAWGILSLVLLLSTGAVAWMQDRSLQMSGNRWAQGYSFLFLFLLISTLLELPVDLYAHHLSLRYGLSVQGWPSWLWDQAKVFALSWGIGGLLVMLLFWIIRRLPRLWWLVFWCVSIPILFFGIFAAPYLEPLFFNYQPLEKTNPALVARLEQVVQKGQMDIPPERMFLMKASAKLSTLNADVEGFGASKRVVVWDTTIARMSPDEIVFVFGHESGHYVLHHIRDTLIFVLILLLVTFYLGYRFVQWAISRFGPGWSVGSQDDWAALAVLLLAFSIFGTLLEPIQNAYSRAHEHAADVYGEEAIHGLVADPRDTARRAFDVLGRTSLDDPNPNPLYVFWTYSHPSIGYRAAFAEGYDPWAPGMMPRYFKK